MRPRSRARRQNASPRHDRNPATDIQRQTALDIRVVPTEPTCAALATRGCRGAAPAKRRVPAAATRCDRGAVPSRVRSLSATAAKRRLLAIETGRCRVSEREAMSTANSRSQLAAGMRARAWPARVPCHQTAGASAAATTSSWLRMELKGPWAAIVRLSNRRWSAARRLQRFSCR
jgi:hypothetical protein